MKVNGRSSILVALVLVILCGVSYAQRTTATFAGILTDPSGAVLPGAEVQLINEGTRFARFGSRANVFVGMPASSKTFLRFPRLWFRFREESSCRSESVLDSA
jgi:hypothetical protein